MFNILVNKYGHIETVSLTFTEQNSTKAVNDYSVYTLSLAIYNVLLEKSFIRNQNHKT